MKIQPLIFKFIFSGALALIGVSCHAALVPLYVPAAPPQSDFVWSSTREVRALFLQNGVLWAATSGGVLQRDAKNQWRKFTVRDGLPTNEVFNFRADENGFIIAQTPRGAARFDGEKWLALSTLSAPKKNAPNVTAQAQWREVSLQATLAGLFFETAKTKSPESQILALPKGVGTHISALLPRENDVCVALFGDGLWLADGKKWQAMPTMMQVPPQAREITALAGDKNPEWLGTRQGGTWHYQNGAWNQELQGNEPFDHNAQFMQEFKGALFVSTLENGLAVRSADGWQQVGLDFLSSNAPRGMAEFKDALFVRHGGGAVDECDGFAWKKNVFSTLPRKKVLAIASDEKQIYLGQWGGWSEWDGKNYIHHLTLAELQGLPPMALLPDGETLWFATQSKGIAQVQRATGKIRWHDERNGLPDDWITCLIKVKNEIFAGTFVGGLVRYDGQKWHPIKETKGENVTSLCEDGVGGIFIATRHGVWQRGADGKMQNLKNRAAWLEPEAQTLLPRPNGLWIGTRTGLFFLKAASAKL